MGTGMDFQRVANILEMNAADFEKAIKILHPATSIDTLEEIKYYGGFLGHEAQIEALNRASILACDVLKLRIPKDVFWDAGYPCCPTCGTEMCCDCNCDQFCSACGQDVRWKDDDSNNG